jgi:hypothetical protein
MHAEVMLAIHTFVHHELQFDCCFFTWVECRPTDDSAGRSATLQDFDARLTAKGKLGITHVLDAELGLNRCVELHIAVVKLRLVDRGAGTAGDLRRETSCGSLTTLEQPNQPHNNDDRRHANGCRQ